MQSNQELRTRLTVLACLTIACLAVSSTATAACVDPNTCYGTDVLFSNTDGTYNSAFGFQTLYSNTTGSDNTAIGHRVLYSNSTGIGNTASGALTLFANTTGGFNTATGYAALYFNSTGGSNTANGARALFANTTGSYNTASGSFTLYFNETGDFNTASGYEALAQNSTGDSNTASGYQALVTNTTGYSNIANGVQALYYNTTGYSNTATGFQTLLNNSTGNRNAAYGDYALYRANGNRNVALGYNAGYAITTGVDNIMIGAGQKGKANDSGVIRIGTSNFQKKALIAGIRGVTTGLSNAVPVVIDGNGQLGTISSSRRVKEDIQSMGSVSERLLELRPVTFRYKQPYDDGGTPVQFGLVAEEVAQVFPELVVYGENGEPETVSYHLLSTLLVNELQREHRVNESQSLRIELLEAQVAEMAELKSTLAKITQRVEQLSRATLVATSY